MQNTQSTSNGENAFCVGMVVTGVIAAVSLTGTAENATIGFIAALGFAASCAAAAVAEFRHYHREKSRVKMNPNGLVSGYIYGDVDEVRAAIKAAEEAPAETCESYIGEDGRRYVDDFGAIKAQMEADQRARNKARAALDERLALAA